MDAFTRLSHARPLLWLLTGLSFCCAPFTSVKLDVDIKQFNKPESVRGVLSILALCRKKKIHSSLCMTVGTHHT